jgi:predicted RNase H-like HicB family nuclease
VAVVGETRAEVEQLVRDAIPFHLDGLREAGLPVPEPRIAAGVVVV